MLGETPFKRRTFECRCIGCRAIPRFMEECVMARTAVKSKGKAARKSSRLSVKTIAKRPAARPVVKSKSKSATAGRAAHAARDVRTKKPAQVIERKAVAGKTAGAAAAAAHDGMLTRLFGRIKPLFRKPLDPRIGHLVEIFGVEAVNALIAAYRKTQDVAENEIAEAIARGEAAMGPSPHGTWAWHELMTSDVAGTKRFYSSMFGWEASDVEMMPGFNYTIFRRAGREVAGLMGVGPEHGDMPSGWVVYIAVDDVDAASEKAERLGGEVIVPAHDIPVGRWAMIKDPAGAVLCLYRARVETGVG